MADEGDRLRRRVEAAHQLEHRIGAPELVRRVPPGDDQGVEVAGVDIVHCRVDGHWTVALLAGHGVIVKPRDRHRHTFLPEPIERIEQLHVLEEVGGEHQDRLV